MDFIEVHPTVDFPRHVCNECINTLNNISLFIYISRKTNSHLGKNEFSIKVEDRTLSKPEEAIEEYDKGSSKYCRACLSASNLLPFEEKITLLQLFQEITKIDVNADTNVWNVNSICSKCTNELEKALNFLNLSVRNNEVLQRLATVDIKKEVLYDRSFESIMGGDYLKNESTDEHNASDIKEEIIEGVVNRSFDSSIDANENRPLHASIDIKEDNIDHFEDSHQKSTKDKEFQPIEEKTFKCDYSGRGFTQESKLQTHLLLHTGEKPFRCHYCEKSFNRKKVLRKHLFTHTGGKLFRCDYCDRNFNDKGNLKQHLLVHTGEKPFSCQYCEKSFNKKQNLQKHLITHTGEKPFKCDYCTKGYSQKKSLQIHLLTHTGQKPFRCDYCDKYFSDKGNLQRHLLTHTGERPFECDYCDKKYSQRKSLQTHLLTHFGEKPFRCDYCDKNFTDKSNAQRHLLTHTGEKPFKCDYCPKGFARKDRLQSHLNTHTE